MRRRTRIVTGTIGVLLVRLLAAALFLRYQIRKSFPVTSGPLAVAGLEHRVASTAMRTASPRSTPRTTTT